MSDFAIIFWYFYIFGMPVTLLIMYIEHTIKFTLIRFWEGGRFLILLLLLGSWVTAILVGFMLIIDHKPPEYSTKEKLIL